MRRLAPWLCAFVALFVAGTMAEHAWRGVRPHIPEIGRKELEPTLGQGVLLGILFGWAVCKGLESDGLVFVFAISGRTPVMPSASISPTGKSGGAEGTPRSRPRPKSGSSMPMLAGVSRSWKRAVGMPRPPHPCCCAPPSSQRSS